MLVPLVDYLASQHHPHLIAALLVLKWHYGQADIDDRGIATTRACACEIVAWRFLSHLSEREALDHLLYELVPPEDHALQPDGELRDSDGANAEHENGRERTGLWHGFSPSSARAHFGGAETPESLGPEEEDPTKRFIGLNALEIAVVAEAKNFLSQRRVQKIVHAIWGGDIIFWESLSVNTTKKAQKYIKWRTDPFARLRVPMYGKVFEVLFTAAFLGLYYAVLFERNEQRITVTEVFLFIWIAAFAYDEFGEFQDTGSMFYARDFWNYWDVGVLVVGFAYLIMRIVGLVKGNKEIVSASFDVLSLEALFLVPRLFSLLSLNSYFGTLIPCLKEMTKDFLKFLVVVIVLYIGFFTTFCMLGRDRLTMDEIFWDLVYVFFGAAGEGLKLAPRISPSLGPPLMVVFACMSDILLITSLISLLSNSLTRVMAHAREEYFFQYSVFVLDAAASKRLTYFIPPLNLLPLVLLRPLRLGLPAATVRSARIALLKATHWPFVAAIWGYEGLRARWRGLDPDASWYARPPSAHLAAPAEPTLHPRSQSHAHSLRRPTFHASARPAAGGRRPTLAALTNKSEVSLVRPGLSGRDTGAEEIEELKGAVARLTGLVETLSDRLETVTPKEGNR